MSTLKQGLMQTLSRRQKKHITDPRRTKAAVLLPLYYKKGELSILLTKRTETVKNHKGQISFPGGAYEDGDETMRNTALRESAEEIGLAPERIEILGELDDTVTFSSGYVISPFVALISPPEAYKLDPHEVASIIEVPLSALMETDSLHVEGQTINGRPVPQYFYHYKDNVIWGRTAAILKEFLDIFTSLPDTSHD